MSLSNFQLIHAYFVGNWHLMSPVAFSRLANVGCRKFPSTALWYGPLIVYMYFQVELTNNIPVMSSTSALIPLNIAYSISLIKCHEVMDKSPRDPVMVLLEEALSSEVRGTASFIIPAHLSKNSQQQPQQRQQQQQPIYLQLPGD